MSWDSGIRSPSANCSKLKQAFRPWNSGGISIDQCYIISFNLLIAAKSRTLTIKREFQ